MSYTSSGAAAGGAAAAHAAMINATKASGTIVRVNNSSFATILNKSDKPLVVYAKAGFLSSGFHYLTPYRGLCFYTKSSELLNLPSSAEIIQANKIWIPS
jgi:hypothetical protein